MTRNQEKSTPPCLSRQLFVIMGFIAVFAVISLTILFIHQHSYDKFFPVNHGLRSYSLTKGKVSSTIRKPSADPLDEWVLKTEEYFRVKRDFYRKLLDNLEKVQLGSPRSSSITHHQPSKSISPLIFSTPSNESRFHAVTYASHSGKDDRFCRAIESAIRNNVNITILGWSTPWRGLSQKLEAAMKYAQSLHPDDIILFTDAFDVLYTQSSATIYKGFVSMNSSIIFSAECGCWPHVAEDPDICLKKYPLSPTPYRYLNSGTWIGYAGLAWKMLDEVMKEAGADFSNANDQKLIADLYIQGRFGIQLDFYNKLFQSMHLTLDPPLPYCNPNEDLVFPKNNSPWYNKRTKSTPAVFHFNGGGKRYHLDMESKMWYKEKSYNSRETLDRLKNHMISIPSENTQVQRRIQFDELCPGYIDREYK